VILHNLEKIAIHLKEACDAIIDTAKVIQKAVKHTGRCSILLNLVILHRILLSRPQKGTWNICSVVQLVGPWSSIS
jgi:hypothetical protein